MLTDKQVPEYLNKIHYDKPICRNEETLKALQAAHFKYIPYENLDMLNGGPHSLETQVYTAKSFSLIVADIALNYKGYMPA